MASLLEDIKKVIIAPLSEAFEVGTYLKQDVGARTEDIITYAVVTAIQKNGAAKVIGFTSFDGSMAGKAKNMSTKGWYPAPTVITRDQIPPKILAKIDSKANM